MNAYEGRRNWETWNVNLWVFNDEPTYRYWLEFTDRWRAIRVKEFVLEVFPEGTPDMKSADDLEKVSYMELAENWQQVVKEYAKC